jgi:hypothetical protein
MLKIEYAKLEEDNNKNIKIIENILIEAGKNVGDGLVGKTGSNYNSMQINLNNTNEEQSKINF